MKLKEPVDVKGWVSCDYEEFKPETFKKFVVTFEISSNDPIEAAKVTKSIFLNGGGGYYLSSCDNFISDNNSYKLGVALVGKENINPLFGKENTKKLNKDKN